MVSCVLLAAGQSERFGSPKALVEFQQKPLITEIIDGLIQSQVIEIIVVLGAHHEKIEPHILNHTKVKSVYNKDYKNGQTSSFQAGIKVLRPNTPGAMLLPVDVPFVKVETINLLITHFLKCQSKILIPTYHGKKGHPPIFHQSIFNEINMLPHTQGINTVIHRHQDTLSRMDCDDIGVLDTFNTQEEWQRLLFVRGIRG
ncbi:MAG: nucleotidyltransferase family protein [Candidatus Omnitrophica bacterium]|nr:nucleotidyltransferase family protein [Candidatus Omnitrophota bacterium]